MTDSGANGEFLSAQEAVSLLGVKPDTLYAYVARGLIRSISQPGTRQKLYLREDVGKLEARSRARAGHGPVAAGALRFGDPVFTTTITEITSQGPRYRGRLAVDLARSQQPFEAIAELLWTGVWGTAPVSWPVQLPPPEFFRYANELPGRFQRMGFRDLAALVLQLLAACQMGDPEVHLGGALAAARQMIQIAAAGFGFLGSGKLEAPKAGQTVTEIIECALGKPLRSEGHRLLNAALVLAADHELAASTFAVRAATSTAARFHMCMEVGMCAFDGPLTGRAQDHVELFARQANTRHQLRKRLQEMIARGKEIPGFNHPLYPKGDPRARFLLETVGTLKRLNANARALLSFVTEAEEEYHCYPSFPIGLLAVQLALEMPEESSGALFLLGRLAGHAAHIQEQRFAGFLLRPRARYTGLGPIG